MLTPSTAIEDSSLERDGEIQGEQDEPDDETELKVLKRLVQAKQNSGSTRLRLWRKVKRN